MPLHEEVAFIAYHFHWPPEAILALEHRDRRRFIAYHFHWPPEAILALEHRDRRRWVEEISAINRRVNGE